MDEILRARKLTEEILARAASIKTHMAQVNRSMANMALIEEESKARATREAAEAAKPPLRLMDLPDDLLRLVAVWAGTGTGRGPGVGALGSSLDPVPAGAGAASLAALAMTCRRWRRLAAQEAGLWEGMCRQRWGVTECDAKDVLILDPRQLHLAAGWPKAALGSAISCGGGSTAARGILASVRGAAGAGAATTNPRVARFPGNLGSPALSRPVLGRGRPQAGVPRTRTSPARLCGMKNPVAPTIVAEAGGDSGSKGSGGGSSRRSCLPALPSPPGSKPKQQQQQQQQPSSPSPSPSRLPRTGSSASRSIIPATLGPCPSAAVAVAPPPLAALSISISESSPIPSPGAVTCTFISGPRLSDGDYSNLWENGPGNDTDGASTSHGDSGSGCGSPMTGAQEGAQCDAPFANPSVIRSLGASHGFLPTSLEPDRTSSRKPTSQSTSGCGGAGLGPGGRTRGSAPAASPVQVHVQGGLLVPLLPGGGGDALEPVPLGWVLRAMAGPGGSGCAGGGGGGGGDGDGQSKTTSTAPAKDPDSDTAVAAGAKLNLWQLVYRDRLVGWRGVLTVFRWLQSHGCPEAVSGSLHRQQLLLALRYLHISVGIQGNIGGDSGGAARGARRQRSGQYRTAESLAAEVLLAAPDMVPCLLSLLSNDSGLVVELAAAGLADFLALDQDQLDRERAVAVAAAAAAAAAAAIAAASGGGGGKVKRPRGRPPGEPSIAHLVQLSSNSGRSIVAQLRDGVRSPGIVKQITRCLINLWATTPVPKVLPLVGMPPPPPPPLQALAGGAARAVEHLFFHTLPQLMSGVWQLQEFSARGDPLCLLHTIITFRGHPELATKEMGFEGGVAAVAGPGTLLPFSSPSQMSSLMFPSGPMRSTSLSYGGTAGGAGLLGNLSLSGGGGGGGGGGSGSNSHRQSLAGERPALTAATATPYPVLPLVGPDGRPLGGRAAALVALGGGTEAARWGGGGGGDGGSGGRIVELLGGGYEVMLPRGVMAGAGSGNDPAVRESGNAATAHAGAGSGRSFLPFEAEEFRLRGWLDLDTGEWHMERRCINVPYALTYKGYSDAHGCWGTYTVQQEPGAGAAAPAAAAAAAVVTATAASTMGPAGSSSVRRLRLFRLFRDPSLEPPKDLLKLLTAMKDYESSLRANAGSNNETGNGNGENGRGNEDGDLEESDEDPDMPDLEPLLYD